MDHIYLDMDGVLADFNRGVRELCHRKPVDQMTGTSEETDALWKAIAEVPHFYDQLKPMPGSLQMFQKLYDTYGNKVEILSGIPKPKRHILNAGEDKIRWAHRILSPSLKVNIVYREEKPQYCHGKGDILVDDYEKNIRDWNAMGGNGVLYQNAEQILKELIQ